MESIEKRDAMCMKPTLFTLIGLLALCIFALSACGLFPPAASVTETGGFSIQVQVVSNVVLDMLQKRNWIHSGGASRSVVPRAYLAAQKIDFQLKDESGQAVASWTDHPTLTGGYSSVVGSRTVVAGNYVLYASVYNNPGDVAPVVGGSQAFTVIAGQSAENNTVWIGCIPLNPLALSESTDSDPFTLPTPWSAPPTFSGIEVIGSEKWFTVVPTESLTDFTLAPSAGSSALPAIFVYNQSGISEDYAMAAESGASVSISFCPTTSNSTYYVGVMDLAYGVAGDRSLILRYDPSVLPEAIGITTFGSYISDTLEPNETKVYSFQAAADHVYAINWDDYYCGSNEYTADLLVNAYEADMTELFSADNGYKGDNYYSWGALYEEAVDYTQTIGPYEAGQTIKILIKEFTAGFSSGTFGLMVTDVTP